MEDKLNKFIEQNKKIISQNKILIKQNNEIIDLIKKYPIAEGNAVEEDVDIFNSKMDVGEVLTVAPSINNELNIYKVSVSPSSQLTVKPHDIEECVERYLDDFDSNEFNVMLDNLIGNDSTVQFNISFLVALESLNRNTPIGSGVCILGNSDQEDITNLPEVLRIAMENGAEKIFLPLKSAISVVHAPQKLLNYLVFYKKVEDIFDKLF